MTHWSVLSISFLEERRLLQKLQTLSFLWQVILLFTKTLCKLLRVPEVSGNFTWKFEQFDAPVVFPKMYLLDREGEALVFCDF